MVIINGKSVGASVNIDGRFLNISGKRIEMTDKGEILVDGVPFDKYDETQHPVIKLQVTGNVDNLEINGGEVQVYGNVNSINSTNGNVTCQQVNGDVNTKNGNVSCAHIMGHCTTKNGNISR